LFLLIEIVPPKRLRGDESPIDEIKKQVDRKPSGSTTVGMHGSLGDTQGRLIFAGETQVMVKPFTEQQFVKVARELLKIEDHVKNNWSYTIDIYRAETADDIDQRFESRVRASRDNFHAQWVRLLDRLGPLDDNPPAIVLAHLQAFGVSPPAFREDQDRIKRAFPNDKKRTKQFLIHSYFGKAIATATYCGFKAAIFKLLDIDPTSNWSFFVDVRPSAGESIVTVSLSRKNYGNTFVTEIRNKYLDRGAPVDIFVRHTDGYPVPTTFEPPDDELCIIRLLNEKTNEEGYWKVPLDMEARYGTNQLQPAFNRAFIALFGRDISLDPVQIRMPTSRREEIVDIEYGGMQIGTYQWPSIKNWVTARRANNELPLRLSLESSDLPENLSPAMDLFAIRLIGSNNCWIGHRPTSEDDDYIDIWNQMISIFSVSQRDGVPNKVRLWFSHTEREQKTVSTVFPLFRLRADGTRKREWTMLQKRIMFRNLFRPYIRKDTCIWFRPDYDIFTIYDTDEGADGVPVHWDILENGGSLWSFRNALSLKFGQSWEPADNAFTLIDQYNGPDAIYSITEQTTEDEWRLYVFDWLTGPEIYIRRRSVQEYSKSTHLSHGTFTDIIVSPGNVIWGYQQVTNASPLLLLRPKAPALPLITQKPRIPRTRYIRDQAEKPKTPKRNDLRAGQRHLDNLQHLYYSQDQPVIESDRNPEESRYTYPIPSHETDNQTYSSASNSRTKSIHSNHISDPPPPYSPPPYSPPFYSPLFTSHHHPSYKISHSPTSPTAHLPRIHQNASDKEEEKQRSPTYIIEESPLFTPETTRFEVRKEGGRGSIGSRSVSSKPQSKPKPRSESKPKPKSEPKPRPKSRAKAPAKLVARKRKPEEEGRVEGKGQGNKKRKIEQKAVLGKQKEGQRNGMKTRSMGSKK
jgi:hypothetical protein